MLKHDLPDEIISKAYKAPDGNLAWPLSSLKDALFAISNSGKATIAVVGWAVIDGKRQEFSPGEDSFPLSFVSQRKGDEPWSGYCLRARNQLLEEIESLVAAVPETQNTSSEALFFHPIYVSEDDIRSCIPQDKHDFDRANAGVSAGYPAVEPIIPDLLIWLQDMNWPIARVLSPFLASIGLPLVPHLKKIFQTDDDIWKYWIINEILEKSRELTIALREELCRLSTQPRPSEQEEELDIYARGVLTKFDLTCN